MKRFLTNEDFAPGTVRWNELYLDLGRPLEEQVDDLEDDMVFVEFENGCTLDVDWRPTCDPSGRYLIQLVQIAPDETWAPFCTIECRPEDLREKVREAVQIAVSRKPISR